MLKYTKHLLNILKQTMAKRKVGRPKHRPTKKIQIYVPEIYEPQLKELLRKFAFENVIVLDIVAGVETEKKYFNR